MTSHLLTAELEFAFQSFSTTVPIFAQYSSNGVEIYRVKNQNDIDEWVTERVATWHPAQAGLPLCCRDLPAAASGHAVIFSAQLLSLSLVISAHLPSQSAGRCPSFLTDVSWVSSASSQKLSRPSTCFLAWIGLFFVHIALHDQVQSHLFEPALFG